MVSHGSKCGMGKKQKLHPEKGGALMTHGGRRMTHGGRRMQTSRVARTGGISRHHRLHRLRRPDQCIQPKRLSRLSQPRLQPKRLQHVQRRPNSRETSWCRSSLRSRLHRQSHPRHCLRHHQRCQGLQRQGLQDLQDLQGRHRCQKELGDARRVATTCPTTWGMWIPTGSSTCTLAFVNSQRLIHIFRQRFQHVSNIAKTQVSLCLLTCMLCRHVAKTQVPLCLLTCMLFRHVKLMFC